MFGRLRKLFINRKSLQGVNSNKEKGITKEEMYSFQQGIKLLDERKYEEALIKFDIAISTGLFKEAYRERGYCLQILNFHLDAIDDFSKAIEIFPQNANNFYGRALSKGSLGYYDGAIDDITRAIELSQVKSKENDEVNQVAIQKNIIPPTKLYKDYFEELKRQIGETDDHIRQIYLSSEVRRN